jgi:hypothetical protein
MIENVRGLMDAIFHDFREEFQSQIEQLGYRAFLAPFERFRLRRPSASPQGGFRRHESGREQAFHVAGTDSGVTPVSRRSPVRFDGRTGLARGWPLENHGK